MPRKDKAEKKEERKKIEKRLRDEAMTEMRPIVIGSLAMVASTISNQGERCQDDYCLWYLIFLTRFAPPLHQLSPVYLEDSWTKSHRLMQQLVPLEVFLSRP